MNRLLKLGNEYGYMCITSDRQLPSKEDGYTQKERDDQKSTKGRNKRYNGKDWRFTYVESCTTSKLNKWKIIKEDFTDKELVTIDSVDRILKRVWNDRVKGYTIFDGIKFECSDLDVASLVYSNSFQKYWLMGGKVNWSKPKKSPIDGEIHMYGTLPEDAFYDINLTLESVEKPMGYSKIKHFNFYKKF